MRRLFLICLSVGLTITGLLGCGSGSLSVEKTPATNSVVGTYKTDPKSIKFNWGAKMDDPVDRQKIEQQTPQLKEMLGKISITLNADGTYVGTSPSGASDTGKYTLISDKIEITPAKGAAPEKTRPILTWSWDARAIQMHIPSGAGTWIELNLVKS